MFRIIGRAKWNLFLFCDCVQLWCEVILTFKASKAKLHFESTKFHYRNLQAEKNLPTDADKWIVAFSLSVHFRNQEKKFNLSVQFLLEFQFYSSWNILSQTISGIDKWHHDVGQHQLKVLLEPNLWRSYLVHGDNSSNTTSPAAEVPRVTPPEYFASGGSDLEYDGSGGSDIVYDGCGGSDLVYDASGGSDLKYQNQGSATQRAIPPVMIYPR